MNIRFPAGIHRLFQKYKKTIVTVAGALLLIGTGGVAALLTNSSSKAVVADAKAKTHTDASLGKDSNGTGSDNEVLGTAYHSEDDSAQTPPDNSTPAPTSPPTPTPSPASQPYGIFGNFNNVEVELGKSAPTEASFATSDGRDVDWSGTIPPGNESKVSASMPNVTAAHTYTASFTALPDAHVGDTFTYTLTAGTLDPKQITITIVAPH